MSTPLYELSRRFAHTFPITAKWQPLFDKVDKMKKLYIFSNGDTRIFRHPESLGNLYYVTNSVANLRLWFLKASDSAGSAFFTESDVLPQVLDHLVETIDKLDAMEAKGEFLRFYEDRKNDMLDQLYEVLDRQPRVKKLILSSEEKRGRSRERISLKGGRDDGSMEIFTRIAAELLQEGVDVSAVHTMMAKLRGERLPTGSSSPLKRDDRKSPPRSASDRISPPRKHRTPSVGSRDPGRPEGVVDLRNFKPGFTKRMGSVASSSVGSLSERLNELVIPKTNEPVDYDEEDDEYNDTRYETMVDQLGKKIHDLEEDEYEDDAEDGDDGDYGIEV